MKKNKSIHVGTIAELWRYPVKSMGGERHEVADIDMRGVRGDRLWALRDEELGSLTNAKRTPAILQAIARYTELPGPDAGPGSVPPVMVTLADGSELRSDDPRIHERLSEFLGRRVTLSAVRPASDKGYYQHARFNTADLREQLAVEADEPKPDFSMVSMAKLMELGRYVTPPGTHYDLGALHVITTASLRTLRAKSPGADFDVRRFRPNIVIETDGSDSLMESGWTGATLRVGGATIRIDFTTVRCSMTFCEQPGLAADPRILRTITAEAGRCLGVYATVVTPGRVSVGDTVEIDVPRTSRIGRWASIGATRIKRALLKTTMSKQ